MMVCKMSGRLVANLGGIAEVLKLLSLYRDKSFFYFISRKKTKKE
jgi:hypothetical protein